MLLKLKKSLGLLMEINHFTCFSQPLKSFILCSDGGSLGGGAVGGKIVKKSVLDMPLSVFSNSQEQGRCKMVKLLQRLNSHLLKKNQKILTTIYLPLYAIDTYRKRNRLISKYYAFVCYCCMLLIQQSHTFCSPSPKGIRSWSSEPNIINLQRMGRRTRFQ